jgi:hypothetical protein
MGVSIALGVQFSPEFSSKVFLDRLLRSDFSNFFIPKIGSVSIEGSSLKLGNTLYPPSHELLKGEQIVSPGVTALPGVPDAAPQILDFIATFPQDQKCTFMFEGEINLEYLNHETVVRSRIFRSEDDNRYGSIAVFESYELLLTTDVRFIITDFRFFTKNWQAEGFGWKAAENNWTNLVNAMELLIEVAGKGYVIETDLSIEMHAEDQDWLIAEAKRLPKLVVNLA